MTTTLPTMVLSKELLREIDAAAAETSQSREDLLRAAIRTFLDQERQWGEIQDEVSLRARDAGIASEEDVENFLDQDSQEINP